jgi:3-hydroxyacyl-CoA dehydrogenase
MGPLELADYVGLDTNKFIIDGEDPLNFEMSKVSVSCLRYGTTSV